MNPKNRFPRRYSGSHQKDKILGIRAGQGVHASSDWGLGCRRGRTSLCPLMESQTAQLVADLP